jgi:hypothetical protein
VLPGPEDGILEKADAFLVRPGSSYELRLEVSSGDHSLSYTLRNYIKDSSTQRALFLEPGFDRGDSAIRKGSLAYFKYRAWPKYDAMSSRSSFLDSSLSWEEALSPGLSGSYAVAARSWDRSGGELLLRCELRPLAGAAYRRIDLWLAPGSYRTLRRVYYTPSGRRWKTATYGGYEAEGASGWTMTMVDELTKATATMRVGARRADARADAFFEPASETKEN